MTGALLGGSFFLALALVVGHERGLTFREVVERVAYPGLELDGH